MAINISYLNSIEPYSFNDTFLNTPTGVVDKVVENANSVSDNSWFFLFLLILSVFLIAVTVDPIGLIRLDILGAIAFATGVSTILAVFGLALGFTDDYSDLTIFGAIFFISIVSRYLSKGSGG